MILTENIRIKINPIGQSGQFRFGGKPIERYFSIAFGDTVSSVGGGVRRFASLGRIYSRGL